MQRTVIKLASAAVLLVASACSDDAKNTDNAPSTGNDGGARDSGSVVQDAGTKSDAAARNDGGGSGAGHDAGDLDAGNTAADAGGAIADAQARDAQTVDAASAAADAALRTDAGDAADAAVGSDSGASPALAAWYKFDETTGSVAVDSTGSFANGTLENGTGWTTGKHGGAVNLLGGTSNNFVTLPPDILHGCHDVTVALWMKLRTVTPWSRILDLDGLVDGFIYFTPSEDVSGSSHLLFDIVHPAGANAHDQRASAAYPANTTLTNVWHHFAFTLSGGTGRLYLDGTALGSYSFDTTTADVSIGAGAHAWLGRSMFNDPYLDAAIDDLRVSCTAYSAAQIAAIAQ